ncbi:MAG: hexose kinase [Firmicutes bacterium]|nr:hexose kinase [Bacillota bacterium]
MITVVNLNPCIDWQYHVPAFTYGGMNRVRRTYESAASKGTNVAVVLKNLGQSPSCIGFNFADGGEKLTKKLDSLDIHHDFETVEGAVRVNIKLYDDSTGEMTELNQPGEFVPEIYVQKLEEKVAALSRKYGESGILVLSGSLPAGVPKNIYAALSTLWGGKVFLDGEGDILRLALEADKKLYAIKPNLFELESTFGVKFAASKDIADFCRACDILKDIPFICVSMGAEGAVLVTPTASYFCPGLGVDVRGVQGAGDSMVAGLIHGVLSQVTTPELLRYAVAAASASVTLDGTDLCKRAGFDAMLQKTPQPIII